MTIGMNSPVKFYFKIEFYLWRLRCGLASIIWAVITILLSLGRVMVNKVNWARKVEAEEEDWGEKKSERKGEEKRRSKKNGESENDERRKREQKRMF